MQIAAGLAVLSAPFLPFASDKLKNILNINQVEEEYKKQLENPSKTTESLVNQDTELALLTWKSISKKDVLLPAKHQINKAELLFSKIEDAEITAQLEKLDATKKANEQENKILEPQKEIIEFEDFTKLDIRVGTILEAVKIAKTKKLLQLKVDIGIDIRTIVSGIAEDFVPEEIIGQQVTVLSNLAPRKIRGVESQGMILMTETPSGELAFVEVEQKVTNGNQIS